MSITLPRLRSGFQMNNHRSPFELAKNLLPKLALIDRFKKADKRLEKQGIPEVDPARMNYCSMILLLENQVREYSYNT